MAKIIAVSNQKGGVGKTTTACTLAHYFSKNGKRVLLVDIDGQGHVAKSFGLKKANGLFRLIVEQEPISKVVVNARERLDLVLNDHSNMKVEYHIKGFDIGREQIIIKALEPAQDSYDLIFLDTPPTILSLHILSLVASDYVLCPATMASFGIDGVIEVINSLNTIQAINEAWTPELLGILPTMYDRTTRETTEIIVELQKLVPTGMILPPIPNDTHVREAQAHGLTIWEYAPSSPAVLGYKESGGKESGRVVNSMNRVGGYLHVAEIMQRIIF